MPATTEELDDEPQLLTPNSSATAWPLMSFLRLFTVLLLLQLVVLLPLLLLPPPLEIVARATAMVASPSLVAFAVVLVVVTGRL